MRHLGILLTVLLYFGLSWKGVSGGCQGDYDLYFVIDRYLLDCSYKTTDFWIVNLQFSTNIDY